MPRTPLIAGNWKMFKTAGETIEPITALKECTTGVADVEILVCPPLEARNKQERRKYLCERALKAFVDWVSNPLISYR